MNRPIIRKDDNGKMLSIFKPLKDGYRGNYSHFLGHKLPTRTPMVNNNKEGFSDFCTQVILRYPPALKIDTKYIFFFFFRRGKGNERCSGL